MSDQAENLILVYLRRIDERTARTEEDIRDIKRRLTSWELSVGRLTSDIGGFREDYAGLQVRMDRFDNRLERIERRLDLTGAIQ